MTGTSRVQPAQGTQGPVLEIGGILGQDADRPPRPDRKIDQGPRRRQCRQRSFDLAAGQARQCTQPALGPGRESEERQGGTQALDRIDRAQSAEASERCVVAAPEPTW